MIHGPDGDIAAGDDHRTEERRDDELQNTLTHPLPPGSWAADCY